MMTKDKHWKLSYDIEDDEVWNQNDQDWSSSFIQYGLGER